MITNEQREARKLGLGGSDMAVLFGLSSYKTPYQLYLEKIGEYADDSKESQEQRLGNAFEASIRHEFSLRHNVTIETPDTLIHPFHDFLRANVDGYIAELDMVWECKTTTYKKANEWRTNGIDVIPHRHLLQLAHYCMVTNAKGAWLSVFFGIDDIRDIYYERNLALEEQLLDAAKKFWECVQTSTPPPPVNISDLRLKFPAHRAEKVKTIAPPVAMQLTTLAETRFKIKELSEVEDKYKFNIMQFMEDAEVLVDGEGKPLVSWKANKRGSRQFLMKGL